VKTNRQVFAAWRKWLRTQRDRQDAVGDFARDYLADSCASRLATLSGLDHHMRDDHGAEDKVWRARDAAWREWNYGA